MAKKANYRKIQNAKYYSPETLANCVRLTKKTIFSHIKKGMPADKQVKPYLIYGKEAKDYYRKMYETTIYKTSKDQVICHGCHNIFHLRSVDVNCVFTGKYYTETKAQILVTGNCPECHRKFSRFKSMQTSKGMNTGAPIHIEELTSKEEVWESN